MRFDATYGLEDIVNTHGSGGMVVCKFSTEVSGDMYLSVSGYFASFNWTANYGDSAEFSFTLEGTGALTRADVS